MSTVYKPVIIENATVWTENPVRPEPVEGLLCLGSWFDKLTTNGKRVRNFNNSGYKLFCSALLIVWCSHSIADTDHQSLGTPAPKLSHQPQWNLTITPNGKGLPIGHGSAAQGAQIFALKCAACHGPKGIGGSAEPLMGEIGSLTSDYPEKTVNSYWPYATTLFDYIRRAMPIDAPFSLSANEVYALCAYILSHDDIISDDQELNEENLPQVSMPNRDGFTAIYPDKH